MKVNIKRAAPEIVVAMATINWRIYVTSLEMQNY
jgi:hypothetical protein